MLYIRFHAHVTCFSPPRICIITKSLTKSLLNHVFVYNCISNGITPIGLLLSKIFMLEAANLFVFWTLFCLFNLTHPEVNRHEWLQATIKSITFFWVWKSGLPAGPPRTGPAPGLADAARRSRTSRGTSSGW